MSKTYRCDICDAKVDDCGTSINQEVEHRGIKVNVRIAVEQINGNYCEVCNNCLPPIIVQALGASQS